MHLQTKPEQTLFKNMGYDTRSFFALNIGIQETCISRQLHEIKQQPGLSSHRLQSLCSFIDDDDIKLLIAHLSSARRVTRREHDLGIFEDTLHNSAFTLSIPVIDLDGIEIMKGERGLLFTKSPHFVPHLLSL